MSLLVRHGEIATASERFVAVILWGNETVTRSDRAPGRRLKEL